MTLLLLCLVVALGACARLGAGGADGGSSGAATPGPSDRKPDEPVDPPIGLPDPNPPSGQGKALRQDPDPSVFEARAMRIDHFTIGADGRTVVAYWWGGNPTCFGMKSISVELRSGTRVVTVLEGTREAARDQPCTMEAVQKSAAVVLDEPILTDAANPSPEAGEAVIFDGSSEVKPAKEVSDARLHAVSGYALSADGLTLSIYYVGGTGECYGLASATARRDGAGDLLTVSVREGWIAADDVACDDIGVAKLVQLTLDQPLLVSATLEE